MFAETKLLKLTEDTLTAVLLDIPSQRLCDAISHMLLIRLRIQFLSSPILPLCRRCFEEVEE